MKITFLGTSHRIAEKDQISHCNEIIKNRGKNE